MCQHWTKSGKLSHVRRGGLSVAPARPASRESSGGGFRLGGGRERLQPHLTRAARKVSEAGDSLRDVQQLAGHSSLATTQRYIEGDTDAQRKLVKMI
jgi:integrase